MKIAFYHYPAGKPWYQVLQHLLVRWWTNGPYSHVELILEDKGNDIYTCASSSARDDGVRIKDIHLPINKWDIIEIDSTDNDMMAVRKYFAENANKKYDYLAWVGFIFRFIKGKRNRLFCSEAVCGSIGILQSWRYDPNSMVPIILRLPGAKFIQKGSSTEINNY